MNTNKRLIKLPNTKTLCPEVTYECFLCSTILSGLLFFFNLRSLLKFKERIEWSWKTTFILNHPRSFKQGGKDQVHIEVLKTTLDLDLPPLALRVSLLCTIYWIQFPLIYVTVILYWVGTSFGQVLPGFMHWRKRFDFDLLY